jgi:pyruvate-formate lyase-activating enzyme
VEEHPQLHEGEEFSPIQAHAGVAMVPPRLLLVFPVCCCVECGWCRDRSGARRGRGRGRARAEFEMESPHLDPQYDQFSQVHTREGEEACETGQSGGEGG